jgi:hypothetical protein
METLCLKFFSICLIGGLVIGVLPISIYLYLFDRAEFYDYKGKVIDLVREANLRWRKDSQNP